MLVFKGKGAWQGLLGVLAAGALVMTAITSCFASVGQSYADDGMAALQGWYNSSGLYNTTGWWNSANALETVIDYTARTGQNTYRNNIATTYNANSSGNFLNNYYDDEGWWALTWIKAYDLTGDSRYLSMAKTIFNDMKGGWDATCNGGIWWSKDRNYKNAIANELFLTVAARLHLRTSGDGGSGSYIDWAQREWNWFNASGMINGSNLINDGLTSGCQNNGQTTWSYNQGVILGGLVDLYKSTNTSSYLDKAKTIANAATANNNGIVNSNGILVEPCEAGGCGADGPQFKGIFAKYLYYLYQNTSVSSYRDFLVRNARSVWANDRNGSNQLGLHWAGSFDSADAARQTAAMDVINAAVQFATVGQAENGTLHSLSTEATYGGYHGSGYLAGWNHDGQWVDFNLSVPSAGNYTLILRYACGAGNASRYIYVNGSGVVNNQSFPGTGSWSNYNSVAISNVYLNAGNNTISVIYNSSLGSSNWLNLDELTIQ